MTSRYWCRGILPFASTRKHSDTALPRPLWIFPEPRATDVHASWRLTSGAGGASTVRGAGTEREIFRTPFRCARIPRKRPSSPTVSALSLRFGAEFHVGRQWNAGGVLFVVLKRRERMQ